MSWGSGRWRWRSRLSVVAACLLVLAGCGGTDPEPGDTTPATTARATPPQALEEPDSISFSDLTWTTEVDPETREPLDDVSSYPNNAPAIIAAVNVEEIPGGTELVATWTIDGVEVPDARMTVATEETVADAWVTFQFTRDEATLFPLGVLEVTITGSNGAEVTGEVEIVLPGT